MILASTIVARARLQSVSATTVFYAHYGLESPAHFAAMEHSFDILEYLAGTGDSQIAAMVYKSPEFATKEDAVAASKKLIQERDAQWDNRNAIIFLLKPDPSQPGKYILGDLGYYGTFVLGDRYSIASRQWRAWLPAETGGALSASGAAGASSDSQRFLLEAPSGTSGASGASGQSGAETISLGDMKQKIASLTQEIAVGDGIPAYRECVLEKYRAKREAVHQISQHGDNYRQFNVTIGSGSPAGTLAYDAAPNAPYPPEWGPTRPGQERVEGRDAHLFTATWPGKFRTARPLPAGEYKFYDVHTPRELVLCDGLPDQKRRQWEIFVEVTSPAGVLDEAFFDPQTLGSGDGYISSGDLSTGDLSPAAFSTDDTTTTGDSTTITSLYATGDAVIMALSPYLDLTGHTFDFITGDGTTSLTLTGDAATGDSTTGTLTWAVSSQPWSSGDELMLRITEPWFGVRVDLSPREEGSRTLTDITISWADPQTCSDGYFVALYDGDTVVRTLGYPDSTTTSISNSTGMQWDSIPSLTSTARVNCMDNNWRLVGDVPLTSGLP